MTRLLSHENSKQHRHIKWKIGEIDGKDWIWLWQRVASAQVSWLSSQVLLRTDSAIDWGATLRMAGF